MEFYRDLWVKYHIALAPTDWGTQGPLETFLTGRVAMYPGGSCERTLLMRIKPEQLDWGLAPLPIMEGRGRREKIIYLRLGIFSKTKHPELAFELLKFLIRPEGMIVAIKEGDSLPLRRKGIEMKYFVNEHSEPNEQKEILLKILFSGNFVSAYNLMSHPKISYAWIQSLIKKHIEKFEMEKFTAQQTAERIEKELNEAVKKEAIKSGD